MSDDLARVIYPFSHNWSAQYVARFEFLTDIIVSEAGVEQRIAFRTSPRRVVGTSLLEASNDYHAFTRMLAAAQNIPVVIPDLTRRTVLTAGAIDGATVLSCAAMWLYAGQELLIGDGTDAVLTKINSVGTSTVSLLTEIPAFPAGTPVYPALTAYWPREVATRMPTAAVVQADIEFNVDPLKEQFQAGSVFPTFNGREICPFAPNWRTPLDVKWIWPVEAVDYDRGPINPFRAVDFPTSISTGEYLFESAADAALLIDFFIRMRGRRGSFYKSSNTADMNMVGSVDADENLLFVEGVQLGNDFASNAVFNAVQIELGDGTILRRNVQDIDVSIGNSRLTVDEPFGVAFTAGDVVMISWLLLTRFATDALEVRFQTDQVAVSSVAFQSLPANFDDYSALRSTLEGDDRETIPGDDRVVFTL